MQYCVLIVWLDVCVVLDAEGGQQEPRCVDEGCKLQREGIPLGREMGRPDMAIRGDESLGELAPTLGWPSHIVCRGAAIRRGPYFAPGGSDCEVEVTDRISANFINVGLERGVLPRPDANPTKRALRSTKTTAIPAVFSVFGRVPTKKGRYR